MGLYCPSCGQVNSTTVLETRGTNDKTTGLKRRRVCLGCEYRFTTLETIFSVGGGKVGKNFKRKSLSNPH